MLNQLRRPIRLSWRSPDAPIESCIETVGTLYQKDRDRYHLLLTEPLVQEFDGFMASCVASVATATSTPRLLWLEFSPYRLTLTMQGNGQFSYRHLFEPNMFGVSRYWLQDEIHQRSNQIRLRNFTRNLHLKGSPLPRFLLLDYELWSGQVNLGQYALELEIEH